MQYPASVAITWQTAFDQLSAAAITLLNRLCWLAPDPIPKTLLEVEVPEAEPIDTLDAWEELKQYSFAASSHDKKAFTVHRLIQTVTREKMNEALAQETLQASLNWLDTAFDCDSTDVSYWPVLEPLVPHVLSLLEYTRTNVQAVSSSLLINQVAVLFLMKAQYKTAEPLMRRALAIDDKALEPITRMLQEI